MTEYYIFVDPCTLIQIVLFVLLFRLISCSRSSMDRMSDSGSDDMSSNLVGNTTKSFQSKSPFQSSRADFLIILKALIATHLPIGVNPTLHLT